MPTGLACLLVRRVCLLVRRRHDISMGYGLIPCLLVSKLIEITNILFEIASSPKGTATKSPPNGNVGAHERDAHGNRA